MPIELPQCETLLARLEQLRPAAVESLRATAGTLRETGAVLNGQAAETIREYRETSAQLAAALWSGTDRPERPGLTQITAQLALRQRLAAVADSLVPLQNLRHIEPDRQVLLSTVQHSVDSAQTRLLSGADGALKLCEELESGVHPLRRLAALIDGHCVSDDEWMASHDVVEAAFGRDVVVAATRGKLQPGA